MKKFKELLEEVKTDFRKMVLNLGSSDNFEHMIVVENGKILFNFTSGHSKKVVLPKEVYTYLLNPNKKCDVHHNHPIDKVSFSPADIIAFSKFKGIKSFFAHTKSITFKIERRAKSNKITERVIKKLTDDYDMKVAPYFLNNNLTIYEIENNRPHFICKELDRLKYFKYTHDNMSDIETKFKDIL